jgi:TRAP-type C4-dicarboxylate transport system permease small subunit
LSQKPVGTILVFLFSGIIWIMTFFNAQRRYPLALVGYGSEGWMYLIVSFTFLSMALMHLIQLLRQKRNERIEGKE